MPDDILAEVENLYDNYRRLTIRERINKYGQTAPPKFEKIEKYLETERREEFLRHLSEQYPGGVKEIDLFTINLHFMSIDKYRGYDGGEAVVTPEGRRTEYGTDYKWAFEQLINYAELIHIDLSEELYNEVMQGKTEILPYEMWQVKHFFESVYDEMLLMVKGGVLDAELTDKLEKLEIDTDGDISSILKQLVDRADTTLDEDLVQRLDEYGIDTSENVNEVLDQLLEELDYREGELNKLSREG